MTIWAAVFARGGSKGLPGKNLKLLGGLPLVAHSIRVGLEIPGVEEVFCSTDSAQIIAVAEKHGAIAPFVRPAELAHDESPEWLSWKHLARYLVNTGASTGDLLVSLPATAPLRSVQDVENALLEYHTSQADVVVSYTPAARSPLFNMVQRGEDGFLHTALSSSSAPVNRRQDAPEIYNLTTVAYVTSLRFVLESQHLFAGRVSGIEIPAERALDIDTQLDFEFAEYLTSRRKVGM